MKKVFLGGTCNNSNWRDRVISKLEIDYFNPVVSDWTEECYREELLQREKCDYCLYVITPLMTGAYSIAEVVDDSNKRPLKTIFCFIETDNGKKFSTGQLRSLSAVGKMVRENGGMFLEDLDSVVNYLNNKEG